VRGDFLGTIFGATRIQIPLAKFESAREMAGFDELGMDGGLDYSRNLSWTWACRLISFWQ